MKKVSRRPRLELRQKQSLSLKQKIRITAIIAFSLAVPVFIGVFIYMNFGTSRDALAAATYTWKGNTSNDWGTASNWAPNGVPGIGDNVTINNGAGSNWPKINSNVSVNQINMSAGTFDMNGYTVTAASSLSFSGCTISNGNLISPSFGGLSNSTINNVNFEKTGTGSNSMNGNNVFNTAVVFTLTGNGTWTFSNSTGDTYHGAVTINNNSVSGIFNFTQNSASTINDNVSINNTSTGGVHFGSGSGSSTFAANKYVSIGTFSAGSLTLNRLTQSGSSSVDNTVGVTDLTINSSTLITGLTASCTGNATLTGATVKRKFIVSAVNTTLNNANSLATTTGIVSITKTGGTSNSWTGGNTFGSGNDTVIINNKGSGNITIGNTSGDTYNASLIYFSDSSASSVLHVAYNGSSVFNGDVVLANTSTGGITFGNGSGSSSFAMNKSMSVITYVSGPLTINRSVQSGSSSLSFSAHPTVLTILNSTMLGDFNVAATSTATVNGSTFKKNFTLSGTGVTLTNANSIATESGNIVITKTGSGTDTWSGGNVFGTANSTMTVTNSGTGTLTMANSNGDTFNGDVVLKQISSGALSAATNSTSYFKGDLSTEGTATAINFGTGSGIVEMSGTSAQSIKGSSSFVPLVRRLTINNNRNGVTLTGPVRISLALTLTSGNIYTSSTSLLTIGSGISSVSGASDSSYVDGPLQKTGGQSFVFPVGKSGYMRTVSMSAPSSSTDQFTAEYFRSNPVTIGSTLDAALHHISTCEYWTFTRNTGSSSVTVNFSWNAASCGVNQLTDLRIARWDATLSKWVSAGAVSTSGSTTSGTLNMSSATSTFGSFTLGSSTSNNSLPIELISFKVAPEGSQAKIEWRTATERDNDFFTIERSTDARNYEIVGKVRGAGTSVEPLDYSFIDEAPLKGTSYYRLKQTDYNGKFEYFPPKPLIMEKTESEFHIISVNPNPFTDVINVKYFSPEEISADLKILRMNGTEALSQKITIEEGERVYSVNEAGEFAPGIYIISLTTNDKLLGTYRVVKK